MHGYDQFRPNQQLLLDLQLHESIGTVTRDWAKPYHEPATLVGTPTWQELGNDLTYLDFVPGNPDYIRLLAADSGDLDFTTGAFSGAAWIAPDAFGNRYIFDKGTNATGWGFWLVGTSPYLALTTRQAGPTTQTSYGAANLVLTTWQLIGFTRSGATVRIYLNGVDVTTTFATHVDLASSAASNFVIGVVVGAGAGWYDGDMWRPRVWGRTLATQDMLTIYESERSLFGV